MQALRPAAAGARRGRPYSAYMEEGAAERDALLRRQLQAMSPGRFEQLVFELAQRQDPAVRRLQHPDAGADTLLPATDRRPAEVWQAKRYPDSINWTECEDSLDAAIERYKPSKVIFAFPAISLSSWSRASRRG